MEGYLEFKSSQQSQNSYLESWDRFPSFKSKLDEIEGDL